MTGLNLETFLHLLRADWGAWVSLGAVVLLLAMMTWTSWGSRKALRKCLVLSLMVHLGIVLYGSTLPNYLHAGASNAQLDGSKDGIRQIRVAALVEKADAGGLVSTNAQRGRRTAVWDRPSDLLALADPSLRPARPDPEKQVLERSNDVLAPAPLASASPDVNPPEPPRPEPRPASPAPAQAAPARPQVAPAQASEIPKVVVASPAGPEDDGPSSLSNQRLRPERLDAASAKVEATRAQPAPVALPDAPALDAPASARSLEPRPRPATAPLNATAPVAATDAESDPASVNRSNPERKTQTGVAVAVPNDADLRNRIRRPGSESATNSNSTNRPRAPIPRQENGGPNASIDLTGASAPEGRPTSDLVLPETDLRQRARSNGAATGRAGSGASTRSGEGLGPIALNHATPTGPAGVTGTRGPLGPRPLADIPAVYRSRLDPNRSALAQRAGASPASEQAVERALDWLARHQDEDGRWNGGSVKGSVRGLEDEGRDSFTIHCPRDEICYGECTYAEADTALTGLALIAYLGAGYTHTDGKYSETVRKGLRYLLLIQKPDGDLRGPSRAVGMYCHTMASLALCEAYALTGDERLHEPVDRAVSFLVKAQAEDGLSWRYAPREAIGDTSILGWVILVLRSARVVGISVPAQASGGALGWLGKVQAGQAGGLAKYQPMKPVTPSMTAEAWVCRQLLGTGGPGPASTEAAEYLLAHSPDRDPFNLYYWYYGTLAMYQHGGGAWTRWNAQVRDQLVRRQRVTGHSAGSWDPDEDETYGAHGGRLYSTALATLTLEVYYRYLRFYDEPGPAPMLAPAPGPAPNRTIDSSIRRAQTPPSERRP